MFRMESDDLATLKYEGFSRGSRANASASDVGAGGAGIGDEEVTDDGCAGFEELDEAVVGMALLEVEVKVLDKLRTLVAETLEVRLASRLLVEIVTSLRLGVTGLDEPESVTLSLMPGDEDE
jgi:hypothetical protein